MEVPQPRRFYKLTGEGREASEEAWSDPLQALYGYPREYRSGQGTRLARPGSLPRSPRPRPQDRLRNR